MKIFLALFIFLTLSTHGQSVKIGRLNLLPLNHEKKPAQTLYTTLQVFEDNIISKGKKISLYIEVLPSKSKENKKDPMFILMGGPEQAAMVRLPRIEKRLLQTK